MVESLSWEHGVLLGAALKSEATSAAEFKGKLCLHCNNQSTKTNCTVHFSRVFFKLVVQAELQEITGVILDVCNV